MVLAIISSLFAFVQAIVAVKFKQPFSFKTKNEKLTISKDLISIIVLLSFVQKLDQSIFENTSHFAVIIITISRHISEFIDILSEIFDMYAVSAYLSSIVNFILPCSISVLYYV